MLQHSTARYSFSYVGWLRLAAEYGSCSLLIFMSHPAEYEMGMHPWLTVMIEVLNHRFFVSFLLLVFLPGVGNFSKTKKKKYWDVKYHPILPIKPKTPPPPFSELY